MRERYTRKQKLIIYAICFVGLVGVAIFTVYNGKEEHTSLLAHEGLSTGVITKIVSGRGTNIMNSNVQFTFKIKGKVRIDYQYADWGVTWDSLIGKSFPVIYDTTTPNINHLLIFSEDFETWNLPFPDSLKWVLKFNKKYKK